MGGGAKTVVIVPRFVIQMEGRKNGEVICMAEFRRRYSFIPKKFYFVMFSDFGYFVDPRMTTLKKKKKKKKKKKSILYLRMNLKVVTIKISFFYVWFDTAQPHYLLVIVLEYF